MKKMFTTTILAVVALSAGAALAAGSAADKCQAGKNKAVGTYYACRQKADTTAITKGGSPDYSKCSSKFSDKWDGAATAGVGMCPDHVAAMADMDAYITAQATDAAAIVAGTKSIPTCGDGAVDVAGEHCDGMAFDGYSCASFGLYGSIACTPGCDFDLSGCTACPASTTSSVGACWVLGALGANCDAACAAVGLVYDNKTRTVAGSDGTDAKCNVVLDDLGAVGTGLDGPASSCTFGLGCGVLPSAAYRARCATPPTDSTSNFGNVRRACACK